MLLKISAPSLPGNLPPLVQTSAPLTSPPAEIGDLSHRPFHQDSGTALLVPVAMTLDLCLGVVD